MVNVEPWQLLLALGALFLIIEIFAPSFVFLPIGVGLLISSLIAVWVPESPEIIYISAIIITVVFLSLRTTLRWLVPARQEQTAADRYKGKLVTVVSPVSQKDPGEAKLYGESWTAISYHAEETFQVDDKAVVIGIDGNKLLLAQKPLSSAASYQEPS